VSDQLDMFATEPERKPKFVPRNELAWETLEIPETPEGRLYAEALWKKWGEK
jgi:hypothetical protein